MHLSRYTLALIGVVLLGFILRFWQLGSVPYGVTNDEVSYIYNAYSIWKTGGYSVDGSFLPLSINIEANDMSPVPVYMTAPFVGILGVSPFTGRLPFALASVGSIFLLYGICVHLFKNKAIALVSALPLALSPWHILLSRGAYDAVLALFFGLLFIYVFLKNAERGNIVWSLIPLTLAFYSYHATKIFFVGIVFVFLFLFSKQLIKRKRELVFFLGGCAAIIFSFFLIMQTQGVIRQNVLVWNDRTSIEKAVEEINYQRDKSSAKPAVKAIFHNKPLYFSSLLMKNYVHAFSPQVLFTEGDKIYLNGYALFLRGHMYLVEIIYVICGIAFLLSSKNKIAKRFILLGILLAPLPSAIAANQSYMIRSIMLLPFLSILCGCGIYFLLTFTKKKAKYFIALTMIIMYAVFGGDFLYRYYYQFGTYGSEYWSKSTRDIAEYIGRNHRKYRNVFVSSKEKVFLLHYALNNKIHPDIINTVWAQNGKRRIDNISFLQECFNAGKGDPYAVIGKNEFYIADHYCHTETEPTSKIVDPLEQSKVIWKIYEKK